MHMLKLAELWTQIIFTVCKLKNKFQKGYVPYKTERLLIFSSLLIKNYKLSKLTVHINFKCQVLQTIFTSSVRRHLIFPNKTIELLHTPKELGVSCLSHCFISSTFCFYHKTESVFSSSYSWHNTIDTKGPDKHTNKICPRGHTHSVQSSPPSSGVHSV